MGPCTMVFFVFIERTRIGKIQQKLWVPLQILICLSIVIFGFVLFRCETLSAASHYLSVMLGMHGEITSAQPIIFYLTSKLQLEIFLANSHRNATLSDDLQFQKKNG